MKKKTFIIICNPFKFPLWERQAVFVVMSLFPPGNCQRKTHIHDSNDDQHIPLSQ